MKKRVLLKLLILLLPIGLIVIALNWSIDPGRIFSRSGEVNERQLASLLLRPANVASINWNMNDRLLQKYYADLLPNKPKVLVLGSSRSMQINSAMVPMTPFVNASVVGASLEDLLAVYELYQERDKLPDILIIGIDPWIFNPNNEQNSRWRALSDEYQRARLRLGPQDRLNFTLPKEIATLQMYSELISPSYFQQSIKWLMLPKQTRSDPAHDFSVTTESISEQEIRFSDGSRQYSRDRLQKTSEEVSKVVTQALQRKPLYSLGEFQRLDPDLLQTWKAFIEAIKSHGTMIILFLPPYHPTFYNYLETHPEYGATLEVERQIRAFSQEQGLLMVGSYDPRQCLFSEQDFVDDMHARRESMPKLLGPALQAINRSLTQKTSEESHLTTPETP